MLTSASPEFWKNKRVFLTGHTGFKGSWISLWLQSLGAKVKGYALIPPTTPSLFEVANVTVGMESDIGDIRNLVQLTKSIQEFAPDIIIHMAAQPLVRASYRDPVETYSTNVMGTVHVFEAARQTNSVRAIVNVTTDKCYENREWIWGYREDEPMGGHDPYSNSKGCSELITSSFRQSFFQASDVALASARAGNVIGGGDWAVDRLIPDTLLALEQNIKVVIRNPDAIRPWQHVLEPLSGYLLLAEKLYLHGQKYAEGWNFGPRYEDAQPVRWIIDKMTRQWGDSAGWVTDNGIHPHEAHYLKLDISKAQDLLNWSPRWPLHKALEQTTRWHKAWLKNKDMQQICLEQIQHYTTTDSTIG